MPCAERTLDLVLRLHILRFSKHARYLNTVFRAIDADKLFTPRIMAASFSRSHNYGMNRNIPYPWSCPHEQMLGYFPKKSGITLFEFPNQENAEQNDSAITDLDGCDATEAPRKTQRIEGKKGSKFRGNSGAFPGASRQNSNWTCRVALWTRQHIKVIALAVFSRLSFPAKNSA